MYVDIHLDVAPEHEDPAGNKTPVCSSLVGGSSVLRCSVGGSRCPPNVSAVTGAHGHSFFLPTHDPINMSPPPLGCFCLFLFFFREGPAALPDSYRSVSGSVSGSVGCPADEGQTETGSDWRSLGNPLAMISASPDSSPAPSPRRRRLEKTPRLQSAR